MSRVGLGPVTRIAPGEGREIVASGHRLAVFRTRTGEVYAVQAQCPHRGGPLAQGLLGGRVVVCPMHGYRFDVVTGAAIGGGAECSSLRTFAATVDDGGELFVDVPDAATAADAPPL